MGGALWLLLGLVVGLGVVGLLLFNVALGWVHGALPESVDAKLGQPLWAQLQASPERCTGGTAQRYVEALVQPLERALPGSAFEYRFMVLKDPGARAERAEALAEEQPRTTATLPALPARWTCE